MGRFKTYGTMLLIILGCLTIFCVPVACAQYGTPTIPQVQIPLTLRETYGRSLVSFNAWGQFITSASYASLIPTGTNTLRTEPPRMPSFSAGGISFGNGRLSLPGVFSYYSPSTIHSNNGLFGVQTAGNSSFQWISALPSSLYEYQVPWFTDTPSANSVPNMAHLTSNGYPTYSSPFYGAQQFYGISFQGYLGLLLPQITRVNHLSRGFDFFQEGRYASAIEELEKAVKLPYEKVAKAQGYLLLGISYQELGIDYLDQAERYLKLAAGLQVYNPKVGVILAKVYYQKGRYIEAIDEYARVIEQEPENGEAIRGLALSYFKANDLTRALKELERAETIFPDDLEIIYTMAAVFEKKHLFAEALEYYNRILDQAPESIWAAQATAHLNDIELSGGASSIEDLKEEEIKVLILTAPNPGDLPDNALVVLLDDIGYQVLPDHTISQRIHKLVKILDNRGKDAGEVKFSYDSTYQHVHTDLARVIQPDGTVIGAGGAEIQEVTPWSDFPFYSNIKVLIISLPGVTVGSVIEYQVTIEDIPASRQFTPREIDAGFTLASTNPVQNAWINVSVPADREFTATIVNRESIEPEVVENGEMREYTWRLNDIPGMIVEPMMPPILDISPILYITSFPSWEVIADWWRALEFEAIIPNDAIKDAITQLTQGLSTQEEKARALFYYVASHIRYVGLEYGKGDVRPQSAAEVFEHKYGDCKNKSILLITMLREEGIEAYPVLLSTVKSGRAWEEIPRIDAFDHVIVLCIIDGAWIWMDSTVEASSFGDIPGADQDREALVIFDDGYEFLRIPVPDPEKNMDHEVMDIQVDGESTATVHTTITSTGINAIYSRSYFSSLDTVYRRQHIESIIAGRSTGGSLIDFTIENLYDPDALYTLDFQYTAPDFIEWAGDIGFMTISYLSANKTAIALEERTYPVFQGNTSVGESIVHVTIPSDLEVRYLPPTVTLEIPQILFISDYTVQDNTIVNYLLYEIRALSVPPEDYAAYKEFQEKVDRELKRKIILEKNGQ